MLNLKKLMKVSN